MTSLAILNAIADFLPLDKPTPIDLNLTQENASHTTGTGSESFSTNNMSFLHLTSLFLSVAMKNQDMLKLMVIGGLVEAFRRFAHRAWNWLSNTWFITAYFESSDEAFDWMMVWLGKQNIWANAREVQISTASWGQTYHKGVEIPGEDSGRPADSSYQTKRTLAYLPAFETKHWLKYKGTWISVSRTKGQPPDPWTGRKQESMEICLFTRDRRILTTLLQDAKKVYKTDDEDVVGLFIGDAYNEWRRTSTRKKRPLRSIVLEPETKSMILDDAKEFLSSEKWYTDRGIPYRRGYLLHGVPGSGKTSLIHSIAGELDLDIYVVSLAKKGLDDAGLNTLICEMPARSIALMEDIDAAFSHAAVARDGVSVSEIETPPTGGLPTPMLPNRAQAQESDSKGVTLSGLLNALDGVAAQEGRILFATTNRYDSIDEALCRAGRMDVHVEFKMATRWQAKELFRCFFPSFDAEVEEDNPVRKKFPADAKGVALATPSGPPQTRLTREETDTLAEKFADAVPEGQFSMASLQGHLMRYKERPQDAVDAVAAWVEKESRKRGAGVAKQST